MNKSNILAIDQSYTSSGIIVFQNEVIVHTQKFSTDKKQSIYDRAWAVAKEVERLIQLYNVHVVAMEGLAFGAGGDATRNLAGLQFVIACQAKFILGIDCEIYAPGTIKKVATGKGNSKKELLVEALPPSVRKLFDDMGVKKTTGLMDMTDAYFIGQTAIQHLK